MKGTLTDAERVWFEQWYASFDDSLLELTGSRHASRKALHAAMKKRIQAAIASRARKPRQRMLFIWSAAAALILICSFAALYTFRRQAPETQLTAIVPGKDKAVLTLADGKKILLDEAADGSLAVEHGVHITKTGSGMVSYDFKQAGGSNSPEVYNTIRTPRGGQFRLTLSDGTRIWLNSDSYVRFPVNFGPNERRIEAGGELYLEVAKDPRHKFLVRTDRQTVEVLGTRFNINAYTDESEIRTTLFEGSVKLSSIRSSLILKPGQQSVLSAEQKITIDENADPEVAAAWKNGYFMFDREDIRSAMRKIGRWYDVDVVYQGEVPDDWLGGSISRYKRVEDVLAKLQLTGQIHFKIEGRRVIVMH